MVKELTMDNTIFGLGAANDIKAVESDVDMASNEFEKVFETTTQYADKSELKSDNQKVLKAAEKSVSSEKVSHKKDTASDITRVNKKVSAKLTSKSPKAAGMDVSGSVKSYQMKELNTASDAYSFSVKETLSVEENVTEDVVETTAVAAPETDEGLESEVTSSLVVNQEPVVEEVVVENAEKEVIVDAEVPAEQATVEEDVVVVQQQTAPVVSSIATELIKATTENVKTVTEEENIEENSEETSEENSTVDLLKALDTEDVSSDLSDNLTLDIVSKDVELEVSTDVVTDELVSEGEISVEAETVVDTENVSTDKNSSKIELGSEWEIVSSDEQLFTQEELENIVSKDMDVLDVKDVKPHTPEEIEAGKQNAKSNIEVESSIVVEENSQPDIDTKIVESENSIVNDLAVESQEVVSTNAQVDEEFATLSQNVQDDVVTKDLSEESIVNIEDSVDVVIENNVDEMPIEQEVVMQDSNSLKQQESEQELNLQAEESFVIEPEKQHSNVLNKELNKDIAFEGNNSFEEEALKVVESVDFEKDSQLSELVKSDVLEDEVLEVTADVVVEQEVVELDEQEVLAGLEKEDLSINVKDDSEFVQDSKITEQEDLDAYIDNCIKLAYVETPVKNSQEQDVISVLESKFAEDIQIEEDIEYSSFNDEVTYEDEDVAMEVEYEQVASLDELVDIEEVDDLKLQLKGQVSAVDKSTVTSSSNSTTEQMIRFAIEGETGFEPTMQLSNTFKSQTTLSQQAFQPTAKDVLAQLSEKLSTFNLNAGSKLTMQLSPENLGKIEISLTNTAKGIIAEMTVSSDDTCELMKKNIDDLKDTLQKYGVRFDNVTVKTAPAQQSAANQDYTEHEGNAQKQEHEQKREEKNNGRSFDDTFSSFTEEQDEE